MNNLAIVLSGLGKTDEARKLNEQVLEVRRRVLGPEHPDALNSMAAHNDLGNALSDIGRVEEAIAEYREAIRLDNDYALAHLNLGRALGSQGRLNEAIASFKEAIRLTPGKS